MSEKNYIKSISKNIKSNYLRMIIGAVLSFVSSIIFARGLGPEKYGIYTYITWFTATIACLCGFGFEGTITKFLPEFYFNDEIDDSRLLIKRIIKLQVILISIISVLLLVTIPLWKGMLKVDSSDIYILLVLSILNVLPTILSSIFTSSEQALQRFDIFAKVAIQTQIITFILNLIIIILFKKIEFILIVLILSTFYQVIIYYKDMQKVVRFSIRDLLKTEKVLKGKKRIKKYAAYMYVNIVWQQVVWTRSEYFFLGMYCGVKEIAMYGLAYSLVNMVSMIFSPIMNVLNNYFSELVAKKEENLLKDIIKIVTKYFVISLLFILTLAYTFSKYIIELVYTNTYANVSYLFLVMLTGFVIVQMLSVANSIPFYYEKQKTVIEIGIISGVLNIVLDIILIPPFGAIGAAYANTLTQLICILLVFIYTKKILGITYHFFEYKTYFIISTITLVFMFFTNGILRILIALSYLIIYIIIIIKSKDINFLQLKKVINIGR